MPKYHVTYEATITYEIEAKDEDEAMEYFLDGKCIADTQYNFEVEKVEPVNA